MSLLEKRFREVVSKSKNSAKNMEGVPDIQYPTRFLPFDYANGYIVNVELPNGEKFQYNSIGIVDGSMNTFIGRPGSGKTSFVIQSAANIVRPFKDAVIFFDDIEGGSNLVRREILTQFTPEEMEYRIIYRNAAISAENFYSRIQTIYEEKMSHRDEYEYDTGFVDTRGNKIYKLVPTVYILDSLAMLTPEKLTEEEELSGQMSTTGAAKTNTAVIKRIIPKLKAANIILFIINHVNPKVDINPFAKTKAQVGWLKPDETMPGGNAAIYNANNLTRIDDSTKLKDSEGLGINGKIVDFTLIKTRTNNPGRIVPMVFTYDEGYDQILSLFIFLKSVGRVQSKGAFMSLTGSDIKFTQKGFKEKLLSDSEFAEEFNKAALEELNKLLVKNLSDTEEVKKSNSIIDSIINIGMQSSM